MRFVGYAGRVESVTGLNSQSKKKTKKHRRRRRIDEKILQKKNLQTHEISRSKTPIQIGKGKKRTKLDHIENGEEHESIKPP